MLMVARELHDQIIRRIELEFTETDGTLLNLLDVLLRRVSHVNKGGYHLLLDGLRNFRLQHT